MVGKIIENRFFYSTILSICSFLAAQRFVLNPLDTLVCIIPLVYVFIFWTNISVRNALLMFSLFISVDNASDYLAITYSPIRYIIYVVGIFLLFDKKIYVKKKVVIYIVLLLILIFLTLLNISNIDVKTLWRDVFILILLFPILCANYRKISFPINFDLLNKLIVWYLLSEISNVVIRPYLGIETTDYLSYNSTKSFIIFPSIYYLLKDNFKIGIPLVILTIIVLVSYTTRMIMITYLISIIFILIKTGVLKFKIIILLGICYLVISNLSTLIEQHFEGYKAIVVFIRIFEQGDLWEKAKFIDLVRYNEAKLFFDRDWSSILFGDGLGSGLIDIKNDFDFVKFTDTAFSEKELIERKFYNLHDTWTDIGLRFGLISILIVYFLILKFVLISKSKCIQLIGAILVVLFSCATFSSQGLILISFFFQCVLYQINHLDIQK